MTPERSQSPVELSNSEEDPAAPSTSSNNQLRVKNVSEINSNEAESAPSAPNKRRLPDWMLVGSNSNCKKTKIGAEGNVAQCDNGEIVVTGEAIANGDTSHDDENPESSHCTTNDSTPNDPSDSIAEDMLTSSTAAANEPVCSSAQNISNGEPAGSSADEPNCSSDQKPVKQEPADDDDSSEALGQIMPTSAKDIKPAVKVEKEEATSSTTRTSCKYGIRCYRRNPMHRIEEAHPGDKDYTRPDFPAPPDGTPPCPFGNLCYRRNPTHFQSFSHPPSTDFAKNRRDYKMRLRQQRNPAARNRDMSYFDTDDDLTDFSDDDDLDQDYIPSDLDD